MLLGGKLLQCKALSVQIKLAQSATEHGNGRCAGPGQISGTPQSRSLRRSEIVHIAL